MNDKCYVYDCSNRNYYGYCKTTVCINPKYSKITNITRDAADTFVAKPVTNADRIHSMTYEELASWINDHADCNRRCEAWKDGCMVSDSTCRAAWLEWLKEEVNE